jgi:heme-degrading monooxygenase HmoA
MAIVTEQAATSKTVAQRLNASIQRNDSNNFADIVSSDYIDRSNRAAQKVVIDRFVVPREARAAFVETSGTVQNILKGLPGFVEGFVYEQVHENGDSGFVTTVVWRDERAFELAKEHVAQKLRERGVNPAEKMRELNIQIERGGYERTPF